MIAFAFALLLVSPSQADTEISLPPIVKEGTPGEVLMEDPIVPALGDSTRLDSGSGSVLHQLANEIPLAAPDPGRVGFAQFRGFGKSAEDTDVQAFGIPLNSPLGGGLDQSIFPQFLWSDYRFQAGPSLGAFDPRANAGTLTFIPWTERALDEPGVGGRASQLYSSAGVAGTSAGWGLDQISASAHVYQHAAATFGYSLGAARGPSGILSGQWKSGKTTLRAHFLATDLDVDTYGMGMNPPLVGHQLTVRMIPVLQADVELPAESLLKSSVFYDGTYQNAVALFSSQDHVHQIGTENALLVGAWKFGLSGRYANFVADFIQPPADGVINVQASRDFEIGSWLLVPLVQGVWVAQYGPVPQASFGVKKDFKSWGGQVYGRVSYTRRFPSLQDRFYTLPGFSVGNPSLQPEDDYTAITGFGWKNPKWDLGAQIFTQLRNNIQIQVIQGGLYTVVNSATGSMANLVLKAKWMPIGWLDFGESLGLVASQIFVKQQEFPYTPNLTEIFSVTAHQKGDPDRWSVGATLRATTSSVANVDTGDRLPGNWYVDVEAAGRVWAFDPEHRQAIFLSAKVENVGGQQIQYLSGFYTPGRVYSVSASGTF